MPLNLWLLTNEQQTPVGRAEFFSLTVYKSYLDNSPTTKMKGKAYIYFCLCFSIEMPKGEFHFLTNVKYFAELVSLEIGFQT